MGYELRRQLREVLGPDITGLQRAVALEIADDANDSTRKSYVELPDLTRWTGAGSVNVVRNALKRLAAAGWEFRVPIGEGKDGRVLYAVPGRRMTFVVPPFEGVAVAPPSGGEGGAGAPSEGAGATPSTPQGGAGAHSEGAGAPSQGAGAPPFSSSPHPLMHDGPTEQPADTSYGIPDAARPLVDSMTASGIVVRWPFTGNGWFPVLGLITKCGIPALVEYARRTVDRSPTGIDSAKYFVRGWSELPPKPAAGTPIHTPRPHLRAVGTPEERGIF